MHIIIIVIIVIKKIVGQREWLAETSDPNLHESITEK